MTLQSDLETAVAQVLGDSQKLKDVVNGPASGDGSSVVVDSGTVKSVARAIAEIGDVTNQAIKDLSNVQTADFLAKVGEVLATQGEAEGGGENTKVMTALRVADAIAAQVPALIPPSQEDALWLAIGVLHLRHVVDLGIPIINAADGFADEFEDNTGIVGGWVTDQANEAMANIASGSETSYVEVDGAEETAQSFKFTSTDPVVATMVRLQGDGSSHPVAGDVFTVTIETDDGGVPSDTVLASATARMVGVNGTASWAENFPFTRAFVPADTDTLYWMRLARTSGTGKVRVMWSSSLGYANGNAWRTTGGADAGNDWPYIRFIHHSGAIVAQGTPTARYDTAGDYLTNDTGGYGFGSTTTGWSNLSRTNSNASILLWPELVPGATVKSIWLYNNGNYSGDQNTGAYVMKWNGWGVAATIVSQKLQNIGTGGWSEFTFGVAIPDDGNRYCLGIFFPSHWSSNTMTECAAGGYYAYATESIINGGASITSTGLTQQGGATLPPFWVEYEQRVLDVSYLSRAVIADAVPATARVVALYEDISTTALINTDFIVEVSRDGGITWSAATLTDEGAFSTTVRILASAEVDLSGQPAGQQMVVRARALNAKEQRLHGWWLQWN